MKCLNSISTTKEIQITKQVMPPMHESTKEHSVYTPNMKNERTNIAMASYVSCLSQSDEEKSSTSANPKQKKEKVSNPDAIRNATVLTAPGGPVTSFLTCHPSLISSAFVTQIPIMSTHFLLHRIHPPPPGGQTFTDFSPFPLTAPTLPMPHHQPFPQVQRKLSPSIPSYPA